jgi:tetratricopeptide (TPR) repeat protein
MTRRGVRFVAFAALVAAPIAHAADDEPSRAERAFEEGRALLTRGEFRAACPKFAESQRLDPASGTLLNLALCHEKIQRRGSALLEYRQVVADDPEDTQQVQFANRHIYELSREVSAAKLPTLYLELSPHAVREGLIISVDGIRISASLLASALPVDPGSHDVIASDSRGRTRRYAVEARGTAIQTVRVLGFDEPPSVASPSLTPVYVGMGIAGACLGGSVLTALVAHHKKDIYDRANQDPRVSADGRTSAHDSAARWQVANLVLMAATLVSAGTTTALYLLRRPEEKPATISLWTVPDGAGLSFASTWATP